MATCSTATCSAATVLRRHGWGARSATAPSTCSTCGGGSFRAPGRSADRWEAGAQRGIWRVNPKAKWRAVATPELARQASGRRPAACTTGFPRENQDEADNDVHLVDDEVGEEEDLAAVEWDRENPQMEEAENCPWRMLTSKLRNSTNAQVKVNPFKHTCEESTLTKETISRAKSRWVAEEVKRWVTENHQVGAKELQMNIKDKFKIELPYMRVFNGPAGNIQQYVHDYYSVSRFKATYAYALPALEGKQQWDKVDPGFKLCAPILKRAAGRPRKSRIRPRIEGAGLGARRRKCTRCGGSRHFAKYCDNAVDPAFGESFDENVDTNEDPNEEENDDHNEEAPNDDHNEEAPNDDPNEDDPIVDHNEEAPNYDPNDDPSEAPNDGGQTSVVANSARSKVSTSSENPKPDQTPLSENPKHYHPKMQYYRPTFLRPPTVLELRYPAGVLVESTLRVWAQSRWRGPVELAKAFLTAGFVHLPPGSLVMFRLDEVHDGIT
ncbi:hypothetical protein ACQ4PT_050426 [Festuca glaucescens]